MILSVKFHLLLAAKNVGGVFAKCWVFWSKKEGVTGGQRYLHNKHYSVFSLVGCQHGDKHVVFTECG